MFLVFLRVRSEFSSSIWSEIRIYVMCQYVEHGYQQTVNWKSNATCS